MGNYRKSDMRQLKKKAKQNINEAISYYEKMEKIAREHGMTEEAEKYSEKVQDLRLEISKNMGEAGCSKALASKYDELGERARAAGRYEEAKEYFQKALKVRLELVKKLRLPKADGGLAVNYNKLALVAGNMGDWKEGYKYLDKMRKICLARTREYGQDLDFLNLQRCCFSMGAVLLFDLEDREKARKMFLDVVRIRDEKGFEELDELAEKAKSLLRRCDKPH